MLEKVNYITNEEGQRVGVLLDLETYDRLVNSTPGLKLSPTLPSQGEDEYLVGLSKPELEALAESQLAPKERDRLENLLARNAEGQLSSQETEILDRLLERIDGLTVLKTRARYTLNRNAASHYLGPSHIC
jgi:hypothetical protein